MVIEVLNSKLEITLVFRLPRPREPYTKIHKRGLNHGIMTNR